MSAILSACGRYRPRLDREVQEYGIVVALIGVNPSTADHVVNDATIRKDMGFALRHGWRRIIKGNVFDWRATDVHELARVPAPVSPENLAHLARIGAEADLIVPCWGSREKLPRELRHHLDFTLLFLRGLGKPLACFGMTTSGDPRHTLMLGYDAPLSPL